MVNPRKDANSHVVVNFSKGANAERARIRARLRDFSPKTSSPWNTPIGTNADMDKTRAIWKALK